MPRMSVDELMSIRKNVMRDSVLMKAAKSPPSWNAEKRSARFVMSAQVADRDGDIIMIDGIDTKDFEANPVSLWMHSQGMPIGSWENLAKISTGRPKRLEGDNVFAPQDTDETADRIARMTAAGIIRACSIGFIPDWENAEAIVDDESKRFLGIKFMNSSLMECSLCAIPANQIALAKMASDADRRIATELLEEVLDNWTKTPAGLFMTKTEYEASLKTAQGEKTSIKSATVEHEGMTVSVSGEGADQGFLTKLIRSIFPKHEPEAEAEPAKTAPVLDSPKVADPLVKEAAQARAEAVLKRAETILAQGA